jgi:flagellar hook protein FlgE
MLASMYSGISGLKTNGDSLNAVGNNISNVNTTGYKSSRASFEDVLYQTMTGASGSSQVGRGSALAAVVTDFSQGSFETTNSSTDLAIGGAGFFIVKKSGSETPYYTRAGGFSLDKTGSMINSEGDYLQGKAIDQTSGTAYGVDTDIVISQQPSQPKATTTVDMVVNLDSTSDFSIGAFDPTSPASQTSTSHYASSITVYDSLGTGHVMTVYFRKDSFDPATQQSTWQWYVVPQGGDVQTSGPGTLGNPGILTFNNSGVLTAGGSAQAMTFDFAGAAAGQTVNLVLGSSSGAGATTQYDIASKTNFQSQDGYAPGVLEGITVSKEGIISGTYDNGQILKLYQLDVASFNNPQGLHREGGNLYSETLASGTAYTAAPGQGGMGSIASNSLEQSNVDLATEFVRMIVAQRGYEANSKVITTTDEVLQTLMNLKR